MSFELTFRFNATGNQTLADIAKTVKTLNGEIKQGGQVVKQFDAVLKQVGADASKTAKGLDELASAGQRVKKAKEDAAKATKLFDVGIGSLVWSARQASGELAKLQQQNERNIKQLERQAALAGAKAGGDKIGLQRQFALQDYGKSAADITRINTAFDQLVKSQTPVQESMVASFVKAQLFTEGLMMAANAAKELTVESAKYAARTETLSVVLTQLAKVNNLSVGAAHAEARAVQQLGITRQESLSVINKMIFAQLDLKKSTDLARLAQDAAVIAGQNSSDALAGIIHGIVTRQPEVLRTYGIVVDFERAYIRIARERGRELSAQEKQEIALQMVLSQAPKVAGAYEAAMLTTGKQLSSLTRYTLEAKEAIGEGLVPVLGSAVLWMTDLAKWTSENGTEIGKLSLGISAAAAAYTVLSLTPIGRGAKIGATLLAGAGAAAFAPDMEDTVRDFGSRAVSDVMKRRADINTKLNAPGLKASEAEALKRQFEETEVALKRIKESAADTLAGVYEQRVGNRAHDPDRTAITDPRSIRGDKGLATAATSAGDDIPAAAKRLLTGFNLGGGVSISAEEMKAAVNRRSNPDTTGATINQKAIDDALQLEQARQSAEQFGKAQKDVRKLVETIREQGIDPYVKLMQDEEQAIRDLREKYPLGTSAKMVASIRSAFDTRRSQLMEERLQAVPRTWDQQRRADGEISMRMFTPQALADGLEASGGLRKPLASVEVDASLAENRIATFRERGTRALQAALSFQERMVQLQTGPGGELSAIDRITALRLDAAEKVYNLSKRHQDDLNALEERRQQIAMDREMQRQEFARKQDAQAREFAGRVYDSMSARGNVGIGQMFSGQLDVLKRQLFVNGTSGTFQSLGKIAGGLIPGQENADGTPTFLGKMFAGTIFDRQNNQVERNTASLDRNRKSIDRLTLAISSGSAQFGTTSGSSDLPIGSKVDPMTFLPSIGGVDTSDIARSITGTSKFASSGFGKALSSFGVGAGSLLTAGGFAGFRSGDYSVRTADGKATTASALGYTDTGARAGNIAMSSAAAITGGLSIYSNLKSGNYRGAIGSGLMTAAALNPEPISRAALMIAGALTNFIGGDPKKKRGEAIDNLVNSSRREDPVGQSYTMDLSGRSIDYDYRGGMRTYITVNNNVSAIDQAGVRDFFEQYGTEAAQGVARAWENGQAPDLTQEVRRTIAAS